MGWICTKAPKFFWERCWDIRAVILKSYFLDHLWTWIVFQVIAVEEIKANISYKNSVPFFSGEGFYSGNITETASCVPGSPVNRVNL